MEGGFRNITGNPSDSEKILLKVKIIEGIKDQDNRRLIMFIKNQFNKKMASSFA